MQSLKLFNRESEREGQWLNRHADSVNANVALGRLGITFKALNDCIFGLENIIIIYLAARLALGNVLTVGMIFAFMSYKQSFTDKAVQLVEKALDFRILNLHLERLSDIALTPLERGHDQPLDYPRTIKGGIELRNVSFRYAEAEPFVLDNICLTIEPGRFVTIMGPSGGWQDDAGQDHARAARTDERRGLGRWDPAARVRGQGLPRAGGRRHAGRPALVWVHRRQHLLLRCGIRP
jgi:ATP-binding cassette, subfamily B, bacterial CvaB/MchF/RaxB